MQNFILCVVDAQNKEDARLRSFMRFMNFAFNTVFAAELAVNLFANWLHRFLENKWNWLDSVIVLMSFIDYGPFDIPDWLVRLMRAVRIVRLFGRVKELRKLFYAIVSSLFPMMNAFVILIIVLSICAPAPAPASSRRILRAAASGSIELGSAARIIGL